MKLYHYAVFLRTRAGTVRRNVAISSRSVSKASHEAQNAVGRHLREQVPVLDVVPMVERKGKGESTLRPRSRNPVKVTKARWVMTRKPKARISAILTRKGVQAYVPRAYEEEWERHEPVTERTSPKGKRTAPQWCDRKECIKAGDCKHARLGDGYELICFEARIAVGTGHLLIRCFARDEQTARKVMRADLKARGLGHKRLAGLAKNFSPDPLRSMRGEVIK